MWKLKKAAFLSLVLFLGEGVVIAHPPSIPDEQQPVVPTADSSKFLQTKFNILSDITDLILSNGIRYQITADNSAIHIKDPTDPRGFVKKKDGNSEFLRPFSLGVNFKKWQDYLEKHGNEFMQASDPLAFADQVNKVLLKFGVSHFLLLPPALASPVQNFSDEEKRNNLPAPGGQAHSADPSPKEGPTLELYNDGSVAVLRVPDFGETYDALCLELLLKKVNIVYFAIDLRGNPGGKISNLYHLQTLFFPNEKGNMNIDHYGYEEIKSFLVKSGQPITQANILRNYRIAWDTHLFKLQSQLFAQPENGPLVSENIAVIVDGNTASCGEDFALCAKESKEKAKIFGSRTRGMLVNSVEFDLSEGFSLRLPLGNVISKEGVDIEGKGLIPDFPVTGQHDPLIETISYLTNLINEKIGKIGDPPRCSSSDIALKPIQKINCQDLERDKNATTFTGSQLHSARNLGHVKNLIKFGVDPSLQDGLGRTACFAAVEEWNLPKLRLLIANPDGKKSLLIKNSEGLTPLAWAEKNLLLKNYYDNSELAERTQVLELLRENQPIEHR